MSDHLPMRVELQIDVADSTSVTPMVMNMQYGQTKKRNKRARIARIIAETSQITRHVAIVVTGFCRNTQNSAIKLY